MDARDAKVIETIYNCVCDNDGFDALVSAWSARIGHDLDASRGLLLKHAETADSVLSQMVTEASVPDVSSYIMSRQPADLLIIDRAQRVIGSSPQGLYAFGVEASFKYVDADLFHLSSAKALSELCRSTPPQRGGRTILLRFSEDEGVRLVEAREVRLRPDRPPDIALEVMTLAWHDRIPQLLDNVFGLTEGETDVCRYLMDGQSPTEIAMQRGSSVRTVRTQLSSIFAKTGATSQVGLVRVLSMLSSRQGHMMTGAVEAAFPDPVWECPFGQETRFRAPSGEVRSFVRYGPRGGRPVLLSHGPLTGYGLPSSVRDVLEARGVEILVPIRPGFGNSEVGDPRGDAADMGARAIADILDYLGIESCPAIGLIAGLIPLLRLGRLDPSRCGRTLGLGASLPLTDRSRIAALPLYQRTFLGLMHGLPQAAGMMSRAAFRYVRAGGPEAAARRIYATCAEDIAILPFADEDAYLSRTASIVTAQGHDAFFGDLRMLTQSWGRDYSAYPRSMRLLCGEADVVHPAARLKDITQGIPGIKVSEVTSAGQLVVHSRPDAAIAQLDWLLE